MQGEAAQGGTVIRLDLSVEDDDLERTEADLQLLISELNGVETDQVERVLNGPAPEGSRGTASIEVGALLVTLGGGGALMPVLVGLVQDWLKRRRSGAIKMTIDGDELTLTGVSDATQQRVLEEFFRRHQSDTPEIR